CHVDGAQGKPGQPPRHIDNKLDAFIAGFDDSWLAPIMSEDRNEWMPPLDSGKAWTDRTRTPGDPVYDFVMHAQSWLSAGKPAGVYAVQNGSGGGSSSSTADYSFSPPVAAAMTNIGNCVPTATLFASSTSDVMKSKDETWKSATEMPKTLAETDLTSLDSAVLAKTAV